MPLVLITGLPSSGKTTRAIEIRDYFLEEKQTVHLVSENSVIQNKGLEKNAIFSDAQKEKELRGILKSETLRLLTPKSVVILDAGNYIKGYRYELYCAAKNTGSTQVTVETICPKEETWAWNEARADERYTRETFDALHLRNEEPDSRNRWDFPLFSLQSQQEVPAKAIHQALFSRKPPPPNQSTQSTPLAPANFLYELDKITQAIILEILSARKCGAEGSIKLANHEGITIENISSTVTPAQLARHRRQFLNYTKIHPPSQAETPHGLAHLFAQFLNSTLSIGSS